MIERLFSKIPYLRRPYFQRDRAENELRTARGEIESMKREIDRLNTGSSAGSEAAGFGSRERAGRNEMFFVSKADDRRQDKLIGDLRAYAKNSIAKRQASLEIGPSYNPILPKREGFNVSILDHVEKSALEKKYADHSVDISAIEPVDFIWTSGSLLEVLGAARFDNVVAAHVIEHAPDFVQFISDCSGSLNPDGRLFLYVPDKRYCFDFFQPLSDPAKILADHRLGRSRHSFESYYRNGAMVLSGGLGTWGQKSTKELKFLHGDPARTFAWAEERINTSHYEDAHENYFTPISFAMLIDELCYLKMIDLRLDVLTRSRGCEFLAILRKTTQPEDLSLEAFLHRKLESFRMLGAEEMERIEFAFDRRGSGNLTT